MTNPILPNHNHDCAWDVRHCSACRSEGAACIALGTFAVIILMFAMVM